MRASVAIWSPVLAGTFGAALAAESGDQLEDPSARASYSLGYQMGRDLKRQGVTLDRPALIGGLKDGGSGAEPRVTAEEMSGLLAKLKQRIVGEQQRELRAESEAVKQAGKAFLERNQSQPGVQTTDSGLQYKVIEAGSGSRPGPEDRVRVHYRGTTIEGQEFDSSYRDGKPEEFALNGVIRGWSEGLQLMPEGARYEFYIPYELAFVRRGPLAFQTVIFEVELLAVNPGPAQATATSPARH